MDKRRKNNKHKASNKNAVNAKRPTLSLQKRNELSTLVAKLLEIGFKQSINPKEEWQQYLDTQKILSRVIELEAPLKRKSTNTTPAARLANIDALYKWAYENGIECYGLKIAEFPGYDLGLEARYDIAKHDPLISIPWKAILTEENLDMDFSQTQFDKMSNLKLAYALMLETLKPDSFWKAYIDMLPNEYNTVLYYSVEDMEQLRGSNVLSQALLLCKSIARQYALIYNISQSHQNKITELGRSFRDSFSYDMYRWAVSTVMTRENMIPRQTEATKAEDTSNGDTKTQSDVVTALIPFWDMANHKQGKITSFFNIETQQMASVAQTDFKQGEQIFIHYGDRSNADLMVHNGFINPTNPNDSVAIKLGLSSSDPLFEKRAKLLQMLQIAKYGELLLLPAPEYVSPRLLGFVRVFNMQAEQLDHWLESERPMDLLHIDCALETSLESKTWQFLQTRLMLLLRVFPTTLEEDEAKLSQLQKGEIKLSYIAAMTLEYRVLEKRILLNALDYAKQRTKA